MDPVSSWYTPGEDESPEWGPCPTCGTANAAAARFCQACGRPLGEELEPRNIEVLTAVVVELVSGSMAFALAPDADERLDGIRDVLVRAGAVPHELPGNPHTVAAVFGPAPRDGASTIAAIDAALAASDAATDPDVAVRVGIGASDVRGDDDSALELWRGRVVDLAVRLSRMASPREVILGEGAYRLVRGTVRAEAVDPRVDPDGDDVGPLRFRGFVTDPEPAWTGDAEEEVADATAAEPGIEREQEQQEDWGAWGQAFAGEPAETSKASEPHGWTEGQPSTDWDETPPTHWADATDEAWPPTNAGPATDGGPSVEEPDLSSFDDPAGNVGDEDTTLQGWPPPDQPHLSTEWGADDPGVAAVDESVPDDTAADEDDWWNVGDAIDGDEGSATGGAIAADAAPGVDADPHGSFAHDAFGASIGAADEPPADAGADAGAGATGYAEDAADDAHDAHDAHEDAHDAHHADEDAPAFAPAEAERASSLLERTNVLDALRSALDRAIDSRGPVVVTLGGESGSGRTSVARTFAAEAIDRAWTVEIGCRRPDSGGATWPFAPLVRAVLGIDAPADRSTIEDRARDALDGDGHAAGSIAGYLLGDAGAAPADEIRAAIAQLISTTLARRPLILLVDDADRAPAAARSAFDGLVSSIAGPLLVVLVVHDDADVTATPLSATASAELVERLLAGPNLAPDAIASIVGACRGIPLAVEHLVAMLADDGHLRWEYGRWTPAVDLASLPLPADLSSLVARRIGGLDAVERRVAAVAAIGPEVVDVATLAEAMGSDVDNTRRIASTLTDRGILRRVDDDRFAFGHAVIADVAATYVDREAALAMHLAAAGTLTVEAVPGGDVAEAVGAHLERAYRLAHADHDREAIGRRAAEHLARAARAAADVADEDASLALLRRAAAVLPVSDAGRAGLLLDAAVTLAARGERGPAERLLGDAVRAARAAGDELLELRATVARARMLASSSRIEEQIENLRDAADAAIVAATAREDEVTAAAGWSARGWVHAMRGHFAGAADAFAHAAAASAAGGLRRDELMSLRDLAAATVDGPTPVDEAIDRAGWIRDRVRGTAVEPSASATLAVLLARAGRVDDARAVLAEVSPTPSEDAEIAAVAVRAALAELHAGSADGAESWLRSALDHDIDDAGRAAVLSWLAYTLTTAGRPDDALDAADAAAAIADEDDVLTHVTWRAAKARCLAALGRVAEARALVRLALRLADQTDLSELRIRTRLDLAEVLLASGRANEAGPAARAALRALERKGSVGEVGRARAILDRVAGKRDDAVETATDGNQPPLEPADETPGTDDAEAAAGERVATPPIAVGAAVPDATPNGDGAPPTSDGGADGKRDRHWFW